MLRHFGTFEVRAKPAVKVAIPRRAGKLRSRLGVWCGSSPVRRLKRR